MENNRKYTYTGVYCDNINKNNIDNSPYQYLLYNGNTYQTGSL